jgi:hypothetical protein
VAYTLTLLWLLLLMMVHALLQTVVVLEVCNGVNYIKR